MIVDDAEVAARMKALADSLQAQGLLADPVWRQAFLAVHRHAFVPRFWRDEAPGAFPARWRMIDNATVDHPSWLEAVYSDTTLATELTGVPAVNCSGMHPQVTSSSTMPSLVVAMLEALDVADGMRVLEIGTGTGYSTALLCRRVGDQLVNSIDLNPELTALAGVRLAAHGYQPHLVTGDGAAGVPERAPFDRIIATCGLHQIPSPWIAQTVQGGKILLNLRGPFHGFALVLLTVNDGTATGRFLAQSGGFMPRRIDPARAFDYTVRIPRTPEQPDESHSQLDPQALQGTFGLITQTALPGLVARQAYRDGTDQLCTEIATPDTGWARTHHNLETGRGYRVAQAGCRRLWDEIEDLHTRWLAHDRPSHDRYGLTIYPDTSPVLWLDEPANTWTLDGPHGTYQWTLAR